MLAEITIRIQICRVLVLKCVKYLLCELRWRENAGFWPICDSVLLYRRAVRGWGTLGSSGRRSSGEGVRDLYINKQRRGGGRKGPRVFSPPYIRESPES